MNSNEIRFQNKIKIKLGQTKIKIKNRERQIRFEDKNSFFLFFYFKWKRNSANKFTQVNSRKIENLILILFLYSIFILKIYIVAKKKEIIDYFLFV